MKGYYMPDGRSKVDPYLSQKILTASPEQLISYIFDVGIASCARKDREKACKAVQELIHALNFDYREMATNFFQMYRYILNTIQKGNFDEAYELLNDLKKTWTSAMKVS